MNHVFRLKYRDARAIEGAKILAVTAAQNNTDPEWGFLSALKGYCRERSAKLVVRPIQYKNPTSRQDPQEGDDQDAVWWHSMFEPYLVDNFLKLHKNLVMPDIRIQATAANPLTSLESRSGPASAIYGHTQLSMKTVPTPQLELPKLLYTTGAVTQKNYSATKAGNLAEFHHSHSAIIVEKRGKTVHLREIVWDGECFYDLDRMYYASGSCEVAAAEALIMGDEHQWFMDPNFKKATYTNEDSMVNVLQPKVLIHHDLFDCFSVSPHHNGHSIINTIKAVHGFGNLNKEINDACEFIREVTPEYDHFEQHIIVPSNHHDHLTRWLDNGERHVTAENREVYHCMKAALYGEARMGKFGPEYPNPLANWCLMDMDDTKVRFLRTDESYVRLLIELGMHGHLGPNGSRGGPVNLSKIGVRFVAGHIHSPCIFKGGYWVGTGSYLKLPYTSGPSSWLNTNVVLHANGKRQMVHIIKGKWRA